MASQAELQQIIVDLCAQRGHTDEHFFHITNHGCIRDCFVKYISGNNLLAEARTQSYLHNLAQGDTNAPHVPQVLNAFSNANGTSYIVMEYVPPPAVTLDVWVHNGPSEERQWRVQIATSKVAKIVSWIHACPLPVDAGIGPVGGGVSKHIFFADSEAPMEFASVAALERYINKALERAPRTAGKPTRTVALMEYPLQFCHSDIKWQNFLISPDTLDVWLIDTQHINILPSLFASYALHASSDGFIEAVAEQVRLSRSCHLNNLIHAAALLQQSSDKSLGLDSTGGLKCLPVVQNVNRVAPWTTWGEPEIRPRGNPTA